MRISDNYPIQLKPTNETEQYIIEEAKLWLDNNIFSSVINIDEHMQNVINLGREAALPFMFELLRENNHEEGMYMWFCSCIISEFLKDELHVEGYMPITEWTKGILKLYDEGFVNKALDKDEE